MLLSLLGITGKSVTDKVLTNLRRLSPGSARDIITRAVEQLQNGIYDMPEDRPVWKILPVDVSCDCRADDPAASPPLRSG
ncbi:hypothetical protein ACFXI6_25435 [Streptomyces mirabilis]|uniref:hypothetical protein n=1 Tax=Streptomyces mirabilis TaxID=68239 RepID=UPI0036875E15